MFFIAAGPSKKEARDSCCQKALDALEKECYTVLIKTKFLGDGTTVELAQGSDAPAAAPADLSSNVGHKLLKLMGWSGGGLGKGGQGISEPITATAITNRQGLGAQQTDEHFKRRMRDLIQQYATSSNPYDLVFTSEFSNEQRAEIHKYVYLHVSWTSWFFSDHSF